MTDFSLRLFLLDKRKAVEPFDRLIIGYVQIVQQIIIKILHAAVFQLFLKNPLLIALVFQEHGRQLCRKSKFASVVPFHQRFADCLFTLPAVIHISRIEISKASLQKSVHHLIHSVQVDAGRIVLVLQRQAH